MILFLLFACTSDKSETTEDSSTVDSNDTQTDDSSGPTDDTGTTTDVPQTTALVTTVANDYSVGSLATVNLDTFAVSDELTATTTDSYVRVDDGVVIMINSFGTNSIRLYTPGDWSSQPLEFSTGPNSNPHDAAICAGKLFVSLYGKDHLAIFDPATGTLSGTVDVSEWADADGAAEASDIIEADGKLFVALQRLDGSYQSSEGTIIEVDCASATISRSWDVGGSPSISMLPDGNLLVRSGVYYNADYSAVLFDGALSTLNLVDGSITDHLLESDLQTNFGGVEVVDNHAMVSSVDESGVYTLSCLDLDTWTLTEAERTTSFISDLSANDRGEIWIAARQNYTDAESEAGILVYEPYTCTALTSTWLTSTLGPYDIAFY